MESATATKLPFYPSHLYRDYADLAQLLLDNELTDINVQDLANRMELVGYYRIKGYRYPFCF